MITDTDGLMTLDYLLPRGRFARLTVPRELTERDVYWLGRWVELLRETVEGDAVEDGMMALPAAREEP